VETTPLFEAIRAGDVATVDRILTARPALAGSSDASGLSAVTVAAYHRQWPIVERILVATPDLDLYEAAIVGDIDRLTVMLDEADREAEIEAETGHPGRSNAVVPGEPAVAPIDERSADGFTALHLAAFFGWTAAVRLLLDRGADPNLWATGDLYVQPLHSAVAGGHEETARLLIEAGAEVGSAQREGYTPLMGAAQNGLAATVALLLARGADPKAYNDDILTAADLADRAGHTAIAATIRAAGG
jgi:uncharacterized protein